MGYRDGSFVLCERCSRLVALRDTDVSASGFVCGRCVNRRVRSESLAALRRTGMGDARFAGVMLVVLGLLLALSSMK
jgi:hypothetical protein